jgi:hypothetical protein
LIEDERLITENYFLALVNAFSGRKKYGKVEECDFLQNTDLFQNVQKFLRRSFVSDST